MVSSHCPDCIEVQNTSAMRFALKALRYSRILPYPLPFRNIMLSLKVVFHMPLKHLSNTLHILCFILDYHKKELCVFYLQVQLGTCTHSGTWRWDLRLGVDVWDKTYSQRPFLWDAITMVRWHRRPLLTNTTHRIHPSKCQPGFFSPASQEIHCEEAESC